MRYHDNELRCGFTVIEILAALILMATVVMTISLTLRQLTVTGDLIRRKSTLENVEANGQRTLRELIDRIDVSDDSTRQFGGDASSVSASTWCEVPSGWVERCQVQLNLLLRRDSTSVIAQIGTNNSVQLLTHVGKCWWVFLPDYRKVDWLKVWGRGTIPPFAIGLANEAGDTLVFPIGDRS